MEATHSYTEFAAQERHEPGAGLSLPDRIDAFIASVLDHTHRRALRGLVGTDARDRRDAREQFLARMEAI